MVAKINADTSGGLKITSDTSGTLEIQSAGTTKFTVNSAGVAMPGPLTGLTSINGGQVGGRRNLVINGEMQVSQRVGTTATATANGSYIIDRFRTHVLGGGAYTVQQVTDTPAGFKNAAKVTITTADSSIAAGDYYIMQYRMEGTDIGHLNCGTSDAETVTLSFWVKSSLTGNFGGAMRNAAADRNYPYLYNIAQANTWEKKSITLTLDTTGTWLATTGQGLVFMWDFGSGTTFQGTADQWQAGNFHSAGSQVKLIATNSSTWYVTGVQLEIGSTATDFEHKSFGEELSLCKRYFEKSYDYDVVPGTNTIVGTHASGGNNAGTTTSWVAVNSYIFATEKRDNPTMVAYDTAGTAGKITRFHYGAADVHGQNPVFNAIGTTNFDGYSSGTGGSAAESGTRLHFTATSEL
jgi:hypothetical protein